MRSSHILTALTGLCTVAVTQAPSAYADDTVTYVVSSDSIPMANVEYYDGSVRIAHNGVPLPWQTTATVADALSATKHGAEIRADWRQFGRWRYKYVTVAIYRGDQLLCESTLDVGNGTCYGSVPHRNFPATGDG